MDPQQRHWRETGERHGYSSRSQSGLVPSRGIRNVDSRSLFFCAASLAEFTAHVYPWEGILATDSQSLLDAIADRIQPNPDEPLAYGKVKDIRHIDERCAEWDLLSSIIQQLQQWPNLKLEYVEIGRAHV